MYQQTTHRLAAAVGFTICILIGGGVRAAEPIGLAKRRIAGVNSFGFGGINASLIFKRYGG